MSLFKALADIRKYAGPVSTTGLSDKFLQRFVQDPCLNSAVAQAASRHHDLRGSFGHLMKMPEKQACESVQDGFMNFYDERSVQPFVSLAAQGPWMVSTHGAVIYDAGGYGMLGLGHNPPQVMHALSRPQVMANIMTPSLSQARMMHAIKREIGHTRSTGCPYEQFIALNSGSECVTLAMRIMDVDAATMTREDGPHPGRKSVLVSLKGSFHGRTDRPALASDSTKNVYKKHLASFRDTAGVPQPRTVTPNDVAELRATVEQIDAEGLHVEAILMEPVMGEGNPGTAISREFYDEARRLADEYRSLLLVDSIQAGFRAYGSLSIMDYPDFQDAAPPDFETFSKAVNAGQFPVSVLALGPRVPEIYVRGLYGNTMTTNPRAMDIVTSVLEEFQSPALRDNVVESGRRMLATFEQLKQQFPDAVTHVTGTGLLNALHLNLDNGFDYAGVETLCRQRGLNVIHGGTNALRFTPWFHINQVEIQLVGEVLAEVLQEYAPIAARRAASAASKQ